MKNENRFYVYAYLDPRKPGEYIYFDDKINFEVKFDYEPFYIGKGGTKKQLKRHLGETKETTANNIKVSIISKIRNELNKNPIIIKVASNLTENKAFSLEDAIIKTVGRITFKNGPLSNLVDGKIGGHSNPSPEIRKKLGDATRGKTYEEIHGVDKAQELKNVRVESNKNRKVTKTTKNKMSEKKSLTWQVISSDNQIFIIKNLYLFCKNNNLTNSLMANVSKGLQKQHKGWKCLKLNK